MSAAWESASGVRAVALGAGACRQRWRVRRGRGGGAAWVAPPSSPRSSPAWAPAPIPAGLPTPSKVCKKIAARRGSACRPAPLRGRASRCPPWRLFCPPAQPRHFPPGSIAGGCRWLSCLPLLAGGAGSLGASWRGVRPLGCWWWFVALFPARFLYPPPRRPGDTVCGCARAGGCRLLFLPAPRRGRGAPPMRAAIHTEGVEGGSTHGGTERPRRGSHAARQGAVAVRYQLRYCPG